MNGKTKGILAEVVKRRHRANGLIASFTVAKRKLENSCLPGFESPVLCSNQASKPNGLRNICGRDEDELINI